MFNILFSPGRVLSLKILVLSEFVMKLNRIEFSGIVAALMLVVFSMVFVFGSAAHADSQAGQQINQVGNGLCQWGMNIFGACPNSSGGSGGGTNNPPVDPCAIFDQYGNLPPNCSHTGSGGSGGGAGGGTGGDTGGGTSGGGTSGGTGDAGGVSSAGTGSAGGGSGGGGAWGGDRDSQGYFILPGATTSGAVLGEATTTTDAGTSTPESTSCDMYVTAFLKFDTQNDPEQVMHLQHVLKYFEGANVEENGVFGTSTLDAVNAFQTKYASEILAPWNIAKSTGYVYLTTRKKLNEVYCDHGVTFPLTADETTLIEKAKMATQPAPAKPVMTTQPAQAPAMTQTPTEVPTTPASNTNPVRSFFERLFGR